MATEKTLNTRIKLRYDLYSNWSTNNPKLLAGEVALAYIPTGANNSVAIGEGTVSGTTPPQVLIKVGDGEHNYNDLKYVSALAADVLSACKTEAGLTAFINNVIAGADMATNEKFTELSGKVDTLNGDASTAGSVAKAIKDAIDALDLANTYDAKGAAAAVQSDLDTYRTGVNSSIGGLQSSISGHNQDIAGLRENKADKATTLVGYGITDAYTKTETYDMVMGAKNAVVGASGDLSSANTIYGAKKYADKLIEDANLSQYAKKATTLAGYGISDAYTDVQVDEEISSAMNQLIGASTDASSASTIYGAKKYADEQVDALEEDMGSVDGLSTTNKTVVGAINEVLAAVGTGGTAAVVTMEKSSDGLTYTVKQGNATVGTIDIPKDMVVTAGEVVTNPAGQAAGTYIKLTLANVTDPLYINVGTLVDVYKAKANATQVQVALDSATREISATIVAGSIGTTELADNAVVTAKIADANVTKSKLSTEVQAYLTKVDGIEAGAEVNIIETVKVNGAALTPDSSRAVNVTVPTGALASKDKVAESDLTESLATKINDKANANDLSNAVSRITTAEGEIDALQSASHTHTFVESELNKIAAGDVEKWNGIEQSVKKYADDLVQNAAGNYATAAQGGKADTAIQSVTSVAGNGIKATTNGTAVTIDWDSDVVLVFDCGNSGVTA